MFFKAMPRMSYKANGKTISTKDIFRRVGLDRQLNNALAVESYYINDGETPDIVANNKYGSSNYHWVLLLINDIVNPYEDWPRRDAELFAYVEAKYGVGSASVEHHYRLVSNTSIIVDYDAAKLISGEIEPVSNYDYELDLNQKKRQIFLLKPEFLGKFLKDYQKLMAE